MRLLSLTSLAAAAVLTAAAGASTAAPVRTALSDTGPTKPQIVVMIVGRDGTIRRPRARKLRAGTVRIGHRRCRVPAGTPLAALLHTHLKLRVTDSAGCDPASMFVTKVGRDANRGAAGWEYKIDRADPSFGAADPAGRLHGGHALLWYWCDRAGACERTLTVARTVFTPGGVTFSIVGYDDTGHGVPVAGATVHYGSLAGVTGPDGTVEVRPADGRPHGVCDQGRPCAVVPGQRGRGGVTRGRSVARTTAAALAACGLLGFAGCGLGAGKGTSDVSLTVTRGFGSGQVANVVKSKLPGSETVMRMLERSFQVTTRYGGGFVESINGLSGDTARRDWFYYVNGIEAPIGAATTAVHHGDRVWWDLHDWTETNSIPAVVGSFPEPFVHGSSGRRYPTVLECAADVSAACTQVSKELSAVGVPVASQLLGTGSGTDSISVLVGTWSDLQGSVAAALVGKGPASSGVYARFAPTGLQLLDPHGTVVQTLGPDSGLIAATGSGSASVPTWMITGTDAAGVRSAAAALTPGHLRDHFALAVHGSSDLPVPRRAGT